MFKRLKIVIALLLFAGLLKAQDRIAQLRIKLTETEVISPGLDEKVEVSVNGATIQEFLRGIATAHNLNINIDPGINVKVVNNFSNVKVSDVFLFVCQKYDLDIAFIGPIMSFVPYTNTAPVVKNPVKRINITYDKEADLLSLDLSNDSLSSVVRALTLITKKNVVFAPELSGKIVSGYIQGMPFNNSMDKLAFANDLRVTLTADNFYLLEKKILDPTKKDGNKSSFTGNTPQVTGLDIVENNGLISVKAKNVPITDIISAVSASNKNSFFLFSEPKGNATLTIEAATYDEFLRYLLNGTEYTFKKQGDIYMVGERTLEGLRASKLVQLQYRSVDKVIDVIPADMKKGLEIKNFPDLNGFVISGSQPNIDEVERFIRQIDRVVPVIAIEVMIVDISNSKTLATGIEMGIKDQPTTTGGTVFPGIDLSLGAGAINNLISGINGFGTINLGSVSPNFYITLKALETQGVLKLRSTPQLATLNGTDAKMSIGETQYYLETTNSVVGTQNPQNITTQLYKSVNADLSVSIKPSVSADEQITLDINVKQSSFTDRITPSAPPGSTTRDFKSFIRVKNGEMIMLGGLEENSLSDSGSGVPFLSRIPIIKWFFSSRTRSKKETKLTIFIKPTVLY